MKDDYTNNNLFSQVNCYAGDFTSDCIDFLSENIEACVQNPENIISWTQYVDFLDFCYLDFMKYFLSQISYSEQVAYYQVIVHKKDQEEDVSVFMQTKPGQIDKITNRVIKKSRNVYYKYVREVWGFYMTLPPPDRPDKSAINAMMFKKMLLGDCRTKKYSTSCRIILQDLIDIVCGCKAYKF